MYIYGSGFPKSLNISKALDKMAGAEREIISESPAARPNAKNHNVVSRGEFNGDAKITAPATDAAKQWDGWGTALKPAHEPIVLARKPLSEKTIAENVLKHGTGGINVDACRVESPPRTTHKDGSYFTGTPGMLTPGKTPKKLDVPSGRFPANLIHDGSEEVEEEFAKYGLRSLAKPISYTYQAKNTDSYNGSFPKNRNLTTFPDQGTASRFFYCAKASKKERRGSKHPTVKPIALMRYLCRLITPPGGMILDPFAGTGTTGEAAKLEGFDYILIERDAEYIKDIENRLG